MKISSTYWKIWVYYHSCKFSKSQNQTKAQTCFFRTEDAVDFFVKKHIKIRGKPILFKKAKRICVTVKGIHPEISDDTLLYELELYIEHCSSIRHNEVNHRGATFQDGTTKAHT